MKVSLIVPAYNEEKYISKLLDSVIYQTKLPDEIVVCDNGSTDNTANIVKSYSQLLPLKLIIEPKKGIIPAVEKAWKTAIGDLIIRTDADCILPPDWIEKHISQYQKDKDLSACGGGFYAADGPAFIKLSTPLAANFNRLFLRLVKGYAVLYGGNISIRKSALQKIDGYNDNYNNLQEDIFLSSKLSKLKLKYKYIHRLKNYTSTRRFNSLESITNCFFSAIYPRLYQEKV